MTVKPIIFSGPMVRALLDGRKTQTRRVLKPQPKPFRNAGAFYQPSPTTRPYEWQCQLGSWQHAFVTAPYAVGDALYVREAFYRSDNGYEEIVGAYAADRDEVRAYLTGIEQSQRQYRFTDEWAAPHRKLRPPIHMPRWASRLCMEVTRVRVERVQDISEDDVLAEGIRADMPEPSSASLAALGRYVSTPITFNDGQDYTLRAAFRRLWDSINAKRGHGWDTNPWVVVVEWERVTHRNVEDWVWEREK